MWWVESVKLHYYTFKFEEEIAWRNGRLDVFRPIAEGSTMESNGNNIHSSYAGIHSRIK